MKLPENRTALCFMAHPDDAEMLCAGTLARLAELDWTVHIATATPGDCGTMTENRWDISSRRTREAAAAAALIGATYHCLDERDGFIVYDKPTIRKVAELFRRVAPSVVFVHSPRDYMLDHEQASMLGRGATFLFSIPNISEAPVKEGSAVPTLYYCDAMEGIDALGEPIEPTTLIDISAQIDKKAEMLACHASQREWLMAHHGMDEYLEAMRRHAAMRGRQANVRYAEAFVQHRGHGYPREDLLAGLFAVKR